MGKKKKILGKPQDAKWCSSGQIFYLFLTLMMDSSSIVPLYVHKSHMLKLVDLYVLQM